EGFGQRAFRDDYIVGIKFNMEILDALDVFGLDDRLIVDEIPGFDQNALEVHGMTRRYPEVAARDIVGQRACLEANRQNVFLPGGKSPGVAALSDPLDRPKCPGPGSNLVADLEVFHSHVAGSRQYVRAAAIACYRKGMDIRAAVLE